MRFAVVPDATTEALELRKGTRRHHHQSRSRPTLCSRSSASRFIAVERAPGTEVQYLGFNLRDPILKDVRVRQAIAYALDRRPMIEYLWRGEAQPARSVLPPQSWAYNGDVPSYDHDPDKARALLDAAGYPAVNGVRFHITMKTSTNEKHALDGRRHAAAVARGGNRARHSQLRVGHVFLPTSLTERFSSTDCAGSEAIRIPDIFSTCFHSSRFPPNGANRGYYSNPKVDALIDQARREVDPAVRKPLYAELQRILAEELPLHRSLVSR